MRIYLLAMLLCLGSIQVAGKDHCPLKDVSCIQEIVSKFEHFPPINQGAKRDLIMQNLPSSDAFELNCEGDPLTFPWMQSLMSSLVGNYCDSCLTISEALWNEMPVIAVQWNAGNCGFTDLGFWTVYSCEGDTLQHCETTIAGEMCSPDSVGLVPEDLIMVDTIWQCMIADCSISNDSILCQDWLIDSLIAHLELCGVVCIEGNSGNFVYRHDVNGRELIEFRTTCGTIRRQFFDCSGHFVFECNYFDFGLQGLCDTATIPGLMEGELLWDCNHPIKGSTAIHEDRAEVLQVFPTLFTNSLNILVDPNRFENLVVYNARGREMLKTRIGQSRMHLNTSQWPSGSYFVTLVAGDRRTVRTALKIE